METLKIVSWNVNGLRAVLKKGFWDFLKTEKPHIFGIQETKLQGSQLPEEAKAPLDYQTVWNFAERKGYSGTGVFFNYPPKQINKEFEFSIFNGEGRIIEMEYEVFTLFNIYFPNGQMSDERLQYKLNFYDQCLVYFNRLRDAGKKLIIMGDLNTAHKEIDLKNPKSNENYSGFLPVERAWLDKLAASGYVDTFRQFNREPGQYTWWTYKFKAREKNVGWRIDYFFITENMMENVVDSYILSDVYGSDHCPIGLKIKV